MLKEILVVVLLILSIPVGYLIAWMCNDELIIGRKWFKAIIFVSIIAFIYALVVANYSVLFTMIFIIITTAISLIKSFDKKWTKRII